MIRWNHETRSLTVTVPRWRELVHGKSRVLLPLLALVLGLDALMAFVDLPLAEFMRYLQQAAPRFERFFRAVTELGDSKYYLVPIALLLPFVLAVRQAVEDVKARRMLGWMALALVFVFATIAVGGISNNILKLIFGRARPRQWFDEGDYGFAPLSFLGSRYQSFPSGHSNTAFALAAALTMFVPGGRRFFFALAALVAFSRVAITAHYLSDVIAGSLLGTGIAHWVQGLFARRGWVFVVRKGEVQVDAPGVLLGQKVRAALARLGRRLVAS